jgi:MFS family permease
MREEEIKGGNIRNVLLGVFFASLSFSLVNFFLPFFLKEKGLSALEIGGLFTLSIAAGSLFFGLFFSRILRKIKLKTGLILAGFLNSFRTFILYLFPASFGAAVSQFSGNLYDQISRISFDTTIQHNLKEGEERKTSIKWLLSEGFGLIIGIVLFIFLTSKLSFKTSFLIFSIVALLSLFFYFKVDDKTRFKPKIKFSRLPKVAKKLKLILFSEIIYWLALSSSFSLVITFLVADKLSGGIFDLGILFIALYGSINITSYVTKEKLDKFNELKTSILGMFLLLASAVFVIFSKNFYVIIFAFILEGIGAGIWFPSKTALQWKHTEKENREKVSGWLYGLRGFANSVGPLIGGSLITFIGINAPFYFKAGISIISISIYFYILRKN